MQNKEAIYYAIITGASGIGILWLGTNFLAAAPQLKIVGQALSGQEGLALVTQLQPDLVLLDLSLPDMSGLEVVRRLSPQLNAPQIIVLTLHNIHEYHLVAKAAGAGDVVLKDEVATRLLPSIYALFQISPVPAAIKSTGAA